MQNAVCYHAIERDEVKALELYSLIREHGQSDSNLITSYALINMAIISLKNGNDPKIAITLIDQYLYEVNSGSVELDFVSKDSPCHVDSPNKKDCINALNVLVNAYITQDNTSKAMYYINQAVILGSGSDQSMLTDIYSNLGSHLQNIGDTNGAVDAFLKVWHASGFKPGPLIRRAILVPNILNSQKEAEQVKRDFIGRVQYIITLAKQNNNSYLQSNGDPHDLFGNSTTTPIDLNLSHTLTDWTNAIQTPHFHLHYYGFHDRPIQELVARMYTKVCHHSLFRVASHFEEGSYEISHLVKSVNHAPVIPTQSYPQHNIVNTTQRLLKVGFISSHFGGDEPHVLLLIDVLKRFPRSLFEIHAIGIGPKDPSQTFLDSVDSQYFGVGYNDALAKELVSKNQYNCLVFTEMQNEATLHFMGFQRYAPVQILVMGAPVTSGNPSIDYFISADRLEHPFRTHLKEEQEHYTEQVVLFDGQGISFPQNEQVEHPQQDEKLAAGDAALHSENLAQITMDEFGIPFNVSDKHLYMCFQNLFKLQPSFDKIFAQILHADPQGYVLLQAARYEYRTQKVKQRLETFFTHFFCVDHNDIPESTCHASTQALSKIIFLPRVTSQKLPQLLQKATVVLHPFPFGGSKTAFDVLVSANIPLITFPQPYLRGRMAANFYSTMELHSFGISANECCVANSISDYITKALRLANDKSYNLLVRQAITKRSHRIANDEQTAFEWSRFIIRAMGVTPDIVTDEELMRKHEYIPKEWQMDLKTEKEMIGIQKRWRSGAHDIMGVKPLV